MPKSGVRNPVITDVPGFVQRFEELFAPALVDGEFSREDPLAADFYLCSEPVTRPCEIAFPHHRAFAEKCRNFSCPRQ